MVLHRTLLLEGKDVFLEDNGKIYFHVLYDIGGDLIRLENWEGNSYFDDSFPRLGQRITLKTRWRLGRRVGGDGVDTGWLERGHRHGPVGTKIPLGPKAYILTSILLTGMTSQFVGRKKELEYLEDRYASKDFELILIYGRRRVGKTELIKKFMEDKGSIYCLASLEDKENQLESVKRDMYKHFGGVRPDIQRWTDLFEYFSEKAEDKTVLIIDEFPYLIEENRSVPSYFQKFVDEYLKDRDLMLILCGSSISMMEDLMSYKNPLYGRRTGQIDLKPLPFGEAMKMIPETTFEDIIRYHSVFGSVPFYLKKLEGPTLQDDIRERVCRDTEVLYEEPQILMRQEFRTPNRYFSIMESMASGRTTPKAISDHTKIPLQSIPKYLGELQRIRLIKHECPVTVREKRSRRGVYRIADNFFDFWFRFIGPHVSDLERGYEGFVEDYVMVDLDRYVGRKFEDVCMEYLKERARDDLRFTKIGRWWYRNEEIDIVALNEKDSRIYLGECKWSDRRVGTDLLLDLKEKAGKVRWRNGNREERYILFSRSGFTRELLKMEDHSLELVDLVDLERGFRGYKE